MTTEFLYHCIAAHECGHETVCSSLGIQARAFLEVAFDGRVRGGITLAATDSDRVPLFDRACVGWAGLLAEYLSGYPLHSEAGLPTLGPRTIAAWAAAAWKSRFLLLSAEDRLLLEREPNRSGAAIRAHKILTGPIGSSRLYLRRVELVEEFRRVHFEEGVRLGVVPKSASFLPT